MSEKQERILIFSKNDKGEVLVRGGSLMNRCYIPFRCIDFNSKRIISDSDIYISEIRIVSNNNGLTPGVYKVAYAKNLQGLDECQYEKVDFKNFPALKDLNFRWHILFGG